MEINWQEKSNITIVVPVGIVPPESSCDITISPVLPKLCNFPENSVLVSDVFEVTTSCEILKPILIKLRHCIQLTSEEERACLTFAKAESHEGLPSQHCFEKHEGGVFDVGTRHGRLECSKFSWFSCIWQAVNDWLYPPLICSVAMLYSFWTKSDKYIAHIVVTRDNEELSEVCPSPFPQILAV